ncbi:hypothetical protein LZ31DRAFT_194527 [Colletotrichum somersetense]|nr:hypothetical protein LZ31DRAFT_194527 [Colletotrichum somersetense]
MPSHLRFPWTFLYLLILQDDDFSRLSGILRVGPVSQERSSILGNGLVLEQANEAVVGFGGRKKKSAYRDAHNGCSLLDGQDSGGADSLRDPTFSKPHKSRLTLKGGHAGPTGGRMRFRRVGELASSAGESGPSNPRNLQDAGAEAQCSDSKQPHRGNEEPGGARLRSVMVYRV